ncbi:MAG: FkbM family methyltransferase [Burkholderiales bacterium]
MELRNFAELLVYVNNNTTDELIKSILRYRLEECGIDTPKEEVTLNELRILFESYYPDFQQIADEVCDIKDNLDKYDHLYRNVFKDDISKNVLFHILAYRITHLIHHRYLKYCLDSTQYFDSRIVHYRKDCTFVDCGGLDGKSSVEFALHCPDYKRIFIYEPIDEYYDDCRKAVEELGLNNVSIRKAAVSDSAKTLYFDLLTPGNSRASERGNIEVKAVKIDEDISERIDFIKMDIEGSELQAIDGASEHIRKDNPMLAICVYHKPGDIWQITNKINSINSKYNYYLRHHKLNQSETVLYAVPCCDSASDSYELSITQKRIKYVLMHPGYEPQKVIMEDVFYLYNQFQNHKKALKNSEKVVHELRDWVSQLEEGKAWLESKINDYRNALQQKDKEVDELRRQIEGINK